MSTMRNQDGPHTAFKPMPARLNVMFGVQPEATVVPPSISMGNSLRLASSEPAASEPVERRPRILNQQVVRAECVADVEVNSVAGALSIVCVQDFTMAINFSGLSVHLRSRAWVSRPR
jgi:hypothetical protein